MIEKPEFPPARLIHENFLPEPMNNYRIKKVTYADITNYYPQEKVLWWWRNVFAFGDYFDGGYDSLKEAQQKLCTYCKGIVVEYIDFDPNEDCKNDC